MFVALRKTYIIARSVFTPIAERGWLLFLLLLLIHVMTALICLEIDELAG